MGKIVGLTFAEDKKPAKGGKKGTEDKKPADGKSIENGGANDAGNDAGKAETPPEPDGG